MSGGADAAAGRRMRIVVMGAGAIGSVVGGFLAKAGHAVALVGRSDHMAAIARDGLRIGGIWGEHRVVEGLSPAARIEDAPGAPWDAAIVSVKSYDTAAAIGQLAPHLGADTLVLAYQNGLGNAEAIAARAGWARTVGVRAIYGVRMAGPGHVEVTVIAQPTALGVYDGAAPAGRVRALAEAMDAAGLPTVCTDRIAAALWAKVAYNCMLNPLSALLDVPYGALAETAHTRGIMGEVLRELYKVAGARGIALEPASPENYETLFYERLLPPTAAHYASMRADFVQRRRTEIEALNGAIARLGAESGVAAPANALLTRLVHAREHAYGVRV